MLRITRCWLYTWKQFLTIIINNSYTLILMQMWHQVQDTFMWGKKKYYLTWLVISPIIVYLLKRMYLSVCVYVHLYLGVWSKNKTMLKLLVLFILLVFTDTVFLQFEGLGQPCVGQVYCSHFSTACAHFVSMCHILIILTIIQTFSLLYLLWWFLTSDLQCHYCNFWGTTLDSKLNK